jgi:hypothetical protein
MCEVTKVKGLNKVLRQNIRVVIKPYHSKILVTNVQSASTQPYYLIEK